jgi:SPP1 gp7 family putative phage head morphogenesis protein
MAALAAQGAQDAQDGAQDDGDGLDAENAQEDEQEAQQGGKTALPFSVIHGSFTPDRIKSLVLQLDPDEPDAEQLIRMALEKRTARELGRIISDMLETLYPDGWGGDWTRAEMEAIRVHNAFVNEQKLRDALSRALLDGVDLGISVGVQQLENVGFGFDWTLAHIPARDWAIAYTDQVLEQIAQVTARGVGQSIGRWLENGEPLQSLIDDLQPYFGPDRAARIAATEITRAMAEGSEAAYKESGVVQEQEWASSMDERVCPICSGLTGKRRKFGEPFSLGIAKPPAHVNCRCWTLPVIKEPR